MRDKWVHITLGTWYATSTEYKCPTQIIESDAEHTVTFLSAVLAKVLTARQLGFDSTERLARALHAYETGKGDLADYVIGEHAVAAGCNVVVTFDKTLLRADGFASP